METIKQLKKEIEELCKDYNLPKGNPWTEEIKRGCKKEVYLKIDVLKNVLKLIDEIKPKHPYLDEVKLFIRELKQKIKG